MKKLFLFLFILFSFKLYGTTYYVSSYTGNDGDDGLTWANAFASLSTAEGSVAAGDTVVCNGTWAGVFTANGASGTSGNSIVYIDSLRFTDGYDDTNPDTSYSATVTQSGNNYCIDIDLNYREFLGFQLTATGTSYGTLNCTGDYNMIKNCKMTVSSDNTSEQNVYFQTAADDDTLASCLFIKTAATGSHNVYCVQDHIIYNCTFVIAGDFNCVHLYTHSTTNPFVDVVNCLFYNESTTSQKKIDLNGSNITNEFDYNIHYYPNADSVYYKIGATTYNTHAAFETAIQSYDADGESHSSQEDIKFSNLSTSYTLGSDSPAYGAGTDKGYGTNIGYFQGNIPSVVYGNVIKIH